MSYYRTPFQIRNHINTFDQMPFGSEVYVVPDSEYKKYKQQQVKEEIEVLENRAESYEKTALSIREIIKELREENNLLSSDTKEVKAREDFLENS